MTPPPGVPGLACPVCGRPVPGPGPAPCPGCGLPAAGQAALVVARIGATLTELARDRDALLVTLRRSAPGQPPPPPAAPAYPPVPVPVPAPPRRTSPQQVLLGLGALLLVAGAVAFVALAWTRLGLVFQAAVLVAVTAAACAASAVAARRGLRATEESLAAAGAALLGVVLGAAWAKDVLGAGAVPLRLWAAAACLTGAAVAAGLSWATRTTATWPLAALLAVQPAPLLLLGPDRAGGAAGVAAAVALAAVDLAGATRLRPVLRGVARALAAGWAVIAAAEGLVVAATAAAPGAWAAVGVLGGASLAAGAALAAVQRSPAPAAAGLVVTAWAAALAAGVHTLEAYTLPAAAALVLPAWSRRQSRSWSAEGPALAVALLPSALLAGLVPGVLRLVLVVAGAVLVTVLGTRTHRQAPFVLGVASLLYVVLARVGPYAQLLPRWLLLTAAGLVLLAVGATYERRRQQAREAVAWVAQMH